MLSIMNHSYKDYYYLITYLHSDSITLTEHNSIGKSDIASEELRGLVTKY